MIKKIPIYIKSVVSVIVLFVVAIVTLYGWRFYSEGQISTAYIQAAETRDLESLQKYLSDSCSLYIEDGDGIFRSGRTEFSDTIIYRKNYTFKDMVRVDIKDYGLFSYNILYNAIGVKDETGEQGRLHFEVLVQLNGLKYEIVSILAG